MAFDLKHLLTDPLPDFAFELSESGIAWARPAAGGQPSFLPFDKDVLAVSPLRDNVQRPEALSSAVAKIVAGSAARKRRRAVLILPDFCARVAVLDFDAFPATPDEQLSLIRFRMKKAVPFDVEDAAVRYHAQTPGGAAKGVNVVVVATAYEILARYEAPFRAAGLHAGHITTSSLAALELDSQPGISVVAKLSGRVLSVLVLSDRTLKLLRTVELAEVNSEEIMGVLFPTVAFVEDELGARPGRMLACGFNGEIAAVVENELGVPAQPLQSRWGAPGEFNAGLFGYLESLA